MYRSDGAYQGAPQAEAWKLPVKTLVIAVDAATVVTLTFTFLYWLERRLDVFLPP